jgi:polyhydroxyalkanoate synthase
MNIVRGLRGVQRELQARMAAEHQRFWGRLANLPRAVDAACDTPVGTTARDVVLERASFKLLRYRRATPATYAEPVLFCYALVNRSYILDLQPDKSVVAQYLKRGFDVYMIDWGIPSIAERHLCLEDYVCRFITDAVDFILREHARRDLHMLGYCMGGTLAASYAALHPERIKTLTLLAAPIAFGGRESLLNVWASRRTFDVDAFIDAHGNCPGWFLQMSFLWLKPIQSFIEKATALYEVMDEPRAISSYFAMERWINDNVPVAGETFREFVNKLYQNDELVNGRLHIGGRHVDLAKIVCPLLLLTATNDHLVPPSSTEGIRRRVGSRDIKSVTIGAGHVGLVVGGKAQATLWPDATRWLAERSKTNDEGSGVRPRNFVAPACNEELPQRA